LKAKIEEGNTYKKVKIFCQDESRFGLMPVKRKALTNFGVKPIGECSFQRENFWIYGATEILTGESFYWDFDKMSKYNFEHFINDLSENYSDSLNIVLLDNASIHSFKEKPDNICFINLPPYNPELNPEERVWQYFKSDMGYRIYDDIEALRKFVYRKILKTKKNVLKSIVAFPYIVEAAHALLLI